MELRELAERVLFGRTLDVKLTVPAGLTDARPGVAIERPEAPVRPPGLALARRARAPFPSVAHLDRPGVRGAVLHRFLNHELLAMELMALALLRFPEAPAAFRRGLANAMLEEGEHFRLYRARMEACGVALGTAPASALFWDMLSPMGKPLDFVTGMSLTFEQANLDYAGYYRRAFAKAGDAETAAVLDTVYEDEIGHVKLGLVWFRRWLQPDDDWAAYVEALPDAVQPSRAKGLAFDAGARRRAGFDERWIATLQTFNRSKGRVPDLHWFDPTAELELAGRTPPAIARTLQRDLETLPMFLCARDDAVLVSRPPRAAFLAPLQRAGFAIPEFVTDIAQRRFGVGRPWAAVPSAQRIAAIDLTPKHVFGKDWAVGLREETEAVVCHDLDAVRAAVGAGAWVAKAALGTAGRGLQRLSTPLPEKWLRRALGSGPVVVERWRDRVMDLGLQLRVTPEGVRFDGITRNLVDHRGQHRGVALVKLADGLPEDLRRFLMSDAVQGRLSATAMRVGEALRAAGHRGFAGVDAMIYREADGYALQPLVEVNPRTTMGRVALALRRRIAPGVAAVWVQQAAEPVEGHLVVRGTPPQIVDAVLPTTDPEGARFTTVLYAGSALDRMPVDGLVDPAYASR